MRKDVRTMMLGAAIALIFGGAADVLLAQGGGIGIPPCTTTDCNAQSGTCTPKDCYTCRCDPAPMGAPDPFYCFATLICG